MRSTCPGLADGSSGSLRGQGWVRCRPGVKVPSRRTGLWDWSGTAAPVCPSLVESVEGIGLSRLDPSGSWDRPSSLSLKLFQSGSLVPGAYGGLLTPPSPLSGLGYLVLLSGFREWKVCLDP